MQRTIPLLAGVAIFAIVSTARAADATDKSQYHLFNPTPDSLMRELATDRPDKTEAPYTVDAGRIQLETDLVTYVKDDAPTGERTRGFILNNLNLKFGLTQNTDLQVILPSYVRERVTDGSGTTTVSGVGDLTLRYKWNLLGNDQGDIALAVMPVLKLPTAKADLSNERWEGGLILPVAVALPGDVGMGLMFQYNHLAFDGGGREGQFISTLAFGRDLVGDLAGYVEIYSEANSRSAWVSTFDFGLTYGIGANLQLDAGMNIGLTESADDLNPFVGVSARF
jgi:hypothetical protein